MPEQSISDAYLKNHEALVESTKGAAPAIQIMWCAVALTIFQQVVQWTKNS